MEKRCSHLIPLIAFTSLISAVNSQCSSWNCTGNEANITYVASLNTTASSPWSINATITAVQTAKPASSTLSSQLEDVMTSHTSESVSKTEAPVSSRHINTTDGSISSLNTTSGHSIIIITSTSTFKTPKSYTDVTTLNPISVTAGVSVLPKTSTTVYSSIRASEMTATPSQAPDSGLTLLAFGVMSLILILIVVMVILVTAINLRGRCKDTKQHEGIKSCDSVVSDSNMTSNCDKESITLVSVRTINTDKNTDSPQISSVHSTIVDNDDQELTCRASKMDYDFTVRDA